MRILLIILSILFFFHPVVYAAPFTIPYCGSIPNPPPEENYAPFGSLDSATTTTCSGWAWDQNAGTSPINVKIYANDIYNGIVSADDSRPDLIGFMGITDAYHGFSYNYVGLGAGSYTIRAYGVDSTSGNNYELWSSPKYITIPALAILFQDNFDTETIANPMEGTPNGSTPYGGWAWSGVPSSSDQRTVGGTTHYPSEFVSPGRGGTGKCFANWRNGTSWCAEAWERNAYWEVLNFNGIQDGEYRELYIGWSLKIPSGMTCYNHQKFNYSPQAWPPQDGLFDNGGPGISLDYSLHNIVFMPTSAFGNPTTEIPLFTVPDDGDWHFYLYRMKLNSATGVQDGILESWIDGVKQTANCRYDLDYAIKSTSYFRGGALSRLSIGLGNAFENELFWQDSWKALLIDDFVVSTEYIGPP